MPVLSDKQQQHHKSAPRAVGRPSHRLSQKRGGKYGRLENEHDDEEEGDEENDIRRAQEEEEEELRQQRSHEEEMQQLDDAAELDL